MSGAVTKRPKTAEAGFSIVELMVALVLVAIFLAGVVELFVSSKRNSNAVEKLSELQETGRVAMQLITADIRRAGNYGGLAESADVTGSLPSVAAAGTCASRKSSHLWRNSPGPAGSLCLD